MADTQLKFLQVMSIAVLEVSYSHSKLQKIAVPLSLAGEEVVTHGEGWLTGGIVHVVCGL